MATAMISSLTSSSTSRWRLAVVARHQHVTSDGSRRSSSSTFSSNLATRTRSCHAACERQGDRGSSGRRRPPPRVQLPAAGPKRRGSGGLLGTSRTSATSRTKTGVHRRRQHDVSQFLRALDERPALDDELRLSARIRRRAGSRRPMEDANHVQRAAPRAPGVRVEQTRVDGGGRPRPRRRRVRHLCKRFKISSPTDADRRHSPWAVQRQRENRHVVDLDRLHNQPVTPEGRHRRSMNLVVDLTRLAVRSSPT